MALKCDKCKSSPTKWIHLPVHDFIEDYEGLILCGDCEKEYNLTKARGNN